MIVSVSRRTDIPGYYMPWFMNRIRAGYAVMQNPMNAAQYFKVSLAPDVVDCIVFWSKDPLPALPYLSELDGMGYPFYFQFTLTPYGKDLERFLRPKEEIEKTFLDLSEAIGRERVVWRYDPIIINDVYTMDEHKKQFRRLCGKLGKYTDTVAISFVDLYPKLQGKGIVAASHEQMHELAAYIGKTAKEYGLHAVACSEAEDFSEYGIDKSTCIDQRRIEKILGCGLNIPTDRNQRAHCGCCRSVDIGTYNTCLNGCVYCYANTVDAAAARKYNLHDPMGEMLCGKAPAGIVLLERKNMDSWKTGQLRW